MNVTPPASRRPWSIDEALLYALCARAWELRGKPGYAAALAAILDAFDRAPLTWLERCEERRRRNLWLIELLRETDRAVHVAQFAGVLAA